MRLPNFAYFWAVFYCVEMAFTAQKYFDGLNNSCDLSFQKDVKIKLSIRSTLPGP